MDITLVRTHPVEGEQLLEIQKKAFADDLEKYQDHESSPVNESIERLRRKIELFYRRLTGCKTPSRIRGKFKNCKWGINSQ